VLCVSSLERGSQTRANAKGSSPDEAQKAEEDNLSKNKIGARARAVARSVAWLVSVMLAAASASAAPLGGRVEAGSAVISQARSATTIRQTTDRAIMSWGDFSSAAGESITFLQPGPGAVALNRVTGSAPSLLNGSLVANGRVFILNPNGVVFGSTAQVNVGGLLASTLSMSNADFLNGRYVLTSPADPSQPLGAVVNRGHITAAPGGAVALVAPFVANEGTVVAPSGRIAMAATAGAIVNLDAAGLVSVVVTPMPRLDASVPGGVSFDVASAVNNAHLDEAATVRFEGGKTILGGAGGVGVNTGTLDTSGPGGGTVTMLSDRASVVGPSGRLAANGTGLFSAGGTIRVSSLGAATAPTGRLEARGGFFGRNGTTSVESAPTDATNQLNFVGQTGDTFTNGLGQCVDFVTASRSDLRSLQIQVRGFGEARNIPTVAAANHFLVDHVPSAGAAFVERVAPGSPPGHTGIVIRASAMTDGRWLLTIRDADAKGEGITTGRSIIRTRTVIYDPRADTITDRLWNTPASGISFVHQRVAGPWPIGTR